MINLLVSPLPSLLTIWQKVSVRVHIWGMKIYVPPSQRSTYIHYLKLSWVRGFLNLIYLFINLNQFVIVDIYLILWVIIQIFYFILFFVQAVSNMATGSFLVGSCVSSAKISHCESLCTYFLSSVLLHLHPCFYPVPSSQSDVVTKVIDGICERFFSSQSSQNKNSMCSFVNSVLIMQKE